MSEKKSWYKKWWIWVITVIVSAIMIAIPFVINWAYMAGKDLKEANTAFSASDMINFYGSFLAFLGTVALGALALWQNHVLSQKNDQYNSLMRDMEIQRNLPYFIVDRSQGCNGNYYNYYFLLKNISNNSASNIEITNFNILNNQNNCICTSKKVNIERSSLAGGESLNVEFTNDGLSGENLRMVFYMSYVDKFNSKHTLSATGIIINATDFKAVNFIFKEEELTND